MELCESGPFLSMPVSVVPFREGALPPLLHDLPVKASRLLLGSHICSEPEVTLLEWTKGSPVLSGLFGQVLAESSLLSGA